MMSLIRILSGSYNHLQMLVVFSHNWINSVLWLCNYLLDWLSLQQICMRVYHYSVNILDIHMIHMIIMRTDSSVLSKVVHGIHFWNILPKKWNVKFLMWICFSNSILESTHCPFPKFGCFPTWVRSNVPVRKKLLVFFVGVPITWVSTSRCFAVKTSLTLITACSTAESPWTCHVQVACVKIKNICPVFRSASDTWWLMLNASVKSLMIWGTYLSWFFTERT